MPDPATPSPRGPGASQAHHTLVLALVAVFVGVIAAVAFGALLSALIG